MGDVRKLVDALRASGVTVHEWAGWDGRGNEKTPQIQIKGAIIHHTGTPAHITSAYQGLVTGRSDLPGMLCNFAGNADGSLTVIGSGLAWHAGGGFGPSQGPLAPYANRRNYYTVGLEIVYPGSVPMSDAQYRTALVFAKVVADTFAGGNVEYVRGHFEVNGVGYQGKWDPGWKSGTPIDMNMFRSQARSVVINPPEAKEPMFNTIVLPHTDLAEVREEPIGLPDINGATGFTARYVHLHTGNADVKLSVAHWRLNDGSLEPLFDDNTIIPGLTRTAGTKAPDDAHALVLDYTAPLGLSVVIEVV